MNGRHPRLFVFIALVALAVALPASAQNSGMVKGVVKDEKAQPVEGAKVTIELTEGVTRKFETTTNKKGEYIQIGLPSGTYKVTVDKDKLGSLSRDVRVRAAQQAVADFVLAPGAGAGLSKEQVAKNTELQKLFTEGLEASRAGNQDAAIEKFTQASALNPNCYDCYYNIGFAAAQKKDYPQAESSFKKAIELKADYGDAYNGLATIYNAQRKFEEAAAASAKATELSGGAAGAAAGGGANADAMYNQGVILWNAGKIPDAKKQFEAVIQANPNHAEAHYQLGMALVNEGNLAGAADEFDKYLQLSPNGPNAAQAKALVGQLKK
jgi:tetratricopeptide (TPR) repeat protein